MNMNMNMYERLSSKCTGGRRSMKFVLWGCSVSLLMVSLAIISCSAIKVVGAKPKPASSHISSVSRLAVASACKDTLYKEACQSLLLSTSDALPRTPGELFDLSVQFSIARAQSARALVYNLSVSHQKSAGTTHLTRGLDDCVELLDDSLDRLTSVLEQYRKKNPSPDDIQTWLSAALTNQGTCLEGLKDYKLPLFLDLQDSKAHNVYHFISNSLALFKPLKSQRPKNPNSVGGRRRLLSPHDFPTWVSPGERKLLEASIKDITPHAVVAKDGTGTHTTIAKALSLASLAAGGRTAIYVKAGTYNENLDIPTSHNNVMLYGDGKGKTVIVGNRNAKSGLTTYQTATVAAMGDGFIARDITIVNSAGPAGEQAVALRVGSDKSVVYRCSIIAYQDTLYTLKNRQFYRETDVYGTVDFIFGNSAVVFQSCNLYARKPRNGENNYITAQGRTDPNQNTGISIHNCKIGAASDLAPSKSQISTFLGRPWKEYSRTVIMQSFLDDSIHPSGWSPWSGSFALKTLYYGEYMNSGPGASTSARVNWPTYHPSLTPTEATRFTVASFIAGNLWLPSTGVAFDSGLHA
ncbi:hypothetical protein HHK36_014474 [Tetracentron sinense]|uniref:Pectinesterase n=1 Tax=Tetracentron sinense TaxID=13715 RepID=A0A834Z8D2_TETSI|nr:hypothetical protein HHK36_014474 [Tetracentron sinense]